MMNNQPPANEKFSVVVTENKKTDQENVTVTKTNQSWMNWIIVTLIFLIAVMLILIITSGASKKPEDSVQQVRVVERIIEHPVQQFQPQPVQQVTPPVVYAQQQFTQPHSSCSVFKPNESLQINGCAKIEPGGNGYSRSFWFNRAPHISGKYSLVYKGKLVCQTINSSISNYSSDQCENILRNEVKYPVALQDFVLQFNETITIYE